MKHGDKEKEAKKNTPNKTLRFAGGVKYPNSFQKLLGAEPELRASQRGGMVMPCHLMCLVLNPWPPMAPMDIPWPLNHLTPSTCGETPMHVTQGHLTDHRVRDAFILQIEFYLEPHRTGLVSRAPLNTSHKLGAPAWFHHLSV